jgi:hypothetical protein
MKPVDTKEIFIYGLHFQALRCGECVQWLTNRWLRLLPSRDELSAVQRIMGHGVQTLNLALHSSLGHLLHFPSLLLPSFFDFAFESILTCLSFLLSQSHDESREKRRGRLSSLATVWSVSVAIETLNSEHSTARPRRKSSFPGRESCNSI